MTARRAVARKGSTDVGSPANGTGVVLQERPEGRVDVVLTRPQRANALDSATARQLRKVLETVAASDARVVVLRGEGRNFCGGADLHEMADLGAAEAERFIRGLHRAFEVLRSMPQPVIAQVQGAALGAGLEMMLSCDLSICDERATFGMPEPHVGLPSVIEAALLPALVGLARAREILLCGDSFDAGRALGIGLVNRVVPAGELEERTAELVQQLTRHDARTLQLQKDLMRRWLELPMGEAIEAGVGAFALAMTSDRPGAVMRRRLETSGRTARAERTREETPGQEGEA